VRKTNPAKVFYVSPKKHLDRRNFLWYNRRVLGIKNPAIAGLLMGQSSRANRDFCLALSNKLAQFKLVKETFDPFKSVDVGSA